MSEEFFVPAHIMDAIKRRNDEALAAVERWAAWLRDEDQESDPDA